MDLLSAGTVTVSPAVAQLLWVLALVLATLLVWLLFFCCHSWNQNTSPSMDSYLTVMLKSSGPKAPPQRKKKPKEKPIAPVHFKEVRSVAVGQEPPCPPARTRRRRPLKVKMEAVTEVRSQKYHKDLDRTVLEINTPQVEHLPLLDIKVSDFGENNQQFGSEVGPVCFQG